MDLKPPYPKKVLEKDFPVEYKVPKFQKFDGHKGNTREHVSHFLYSLEKYAKDPELCLKEFSKSLTDRAYTWYLNLKPGTIQDWDHMVATFNTKFFFAEAKYTLAELGRTRQYAGEDLDLYVKRFHDKALEYVDPVDEETLVNVCLHGMSGEYRAFLENLIFSSFSKLMEAARRTNESVRRTLGANKTFSTSRPFAKRKHAVAAVEVGSSSYKKPTQKPDKKKNRSYPPLPPFPCDSKKVASLLKQCVKGSVIQLPPVSSAPTPVEDRDPNFCPYHRRRGHPLE